MGFVAVATLASSILFHPQSMRLLVLGVGESSLANTYTSYADLLQQSW